MKYSSLESEYLVALLKSAVLKTDVPSAPDGLDWSKLIELSRQQQVYAIIATVVNSESIPKAEADELLLYSKNEMRKMLAMKTEQQIIEQELEDRGIRYMLLKGSILKYYYPLEKMRQMSDVDLLYDASKRDDIYELMHGRGYETFNMDDNSDDFKKPPYYTFEFHRELFFDGLEFHPVFDYVWDNATQDKDKKFLYHMDISDAYIYNICHMYKHFIKKCCGIRFLIDNYLYIKKENEALNWNYIESKLDEYGILDFEKSARELALSIFDNDTLTQEQQKMLYKFTDFGIFGDKYGSALQSYNKLKEDNETKNAKLNFMLKRIFPSREFLIPNYPVLKKMPFLLPFVYIHRFFKGIFNKRGINELETIKKLED